MRHTHKVNTRLTHTFVTHQLGLVTIYDHVAVSVVCRCPAEAGEDKGFDSNKMNRWFLLDQRQVVISKMTSK